MAVVLFVNSYDLRVFASTDYNHNELLEYPGYAEAMYESIVEQTTFISGRYTENKDYVNESINEITDYARGWWDEYMRISELPPKEKIREMINAAGGYALTVGDFIKNLFNAFDSDNPPVDGEPDYSFYENALEMVSGRATVKKGWSMTINTPNKIGYGPSFRTSVSYDWRNYTWYSFSIYNHTYSDPLYSTGNVYSSDSRVIVDSMPNTTTVSGAVQALYRMGGSLTLKFEGVEQSPTIIGGSNGFRAINNYIKDGGIDNKELVVPQPTAYLSCPDGTRINMKINGGTFLDVKGNIMSVDKNGTATIDSQICNLGWEKPKIEYIDGTDQVGISTPDDGIIDAETGETIIGGNDEFDDEIKDGCGTLCALGKLLTGLGSIAKAIAAIPLKILDGLFELVKKIVVPPDGFWTEQVEDIEKQFFKEEIKENIDSLKELDGVGGGTFTDKTVSLMGVDNITIIDSSSINMSLDTIHGWVRGIFYPLLLFFNISMLYRLIRGSSFVGIGDTDKGGGKK